MKSELLNDDVYERLREMIFCGLLQGGQKLVDRDLADQLGVSRTPIRDALGRLAMTDLVEKKNRRGFYVRRYTADEVVDLYEFRKILEVNAVKLAARNAKASHLCEFDRLLSELEGLTSDKKDHPRAVKLDLEIHGLIAQASGSHELRKAVQNVLDKVMCFIWVEISEKSAMAAAHREHKTLLRLIKKKDEDGAATLLNKHIDSAQASLVSVLRARDEIRSAVLAGSPRKPSHESKELVA